MAATEIQHGIGKVYAMDGAALSVLAGAVTMTIESGDLEANFDLEELKGQNGEVETLIASNKRLDITVQFAPNGATRAAAIAAAALIWAAEAIEKVTLSGFAIAKYNGDYNLLPGTTGNMRRDQTYIMTMKLRAYITNRTSLTAGAISG